MPGALPTDAAPEHGPAGLEDLVERFDHVALATWDLRGALTMVELLEGRFHRGGVSRRRFYWAQFRLPGGAKLEVLQPAEPGDEEHFLVQFLTTRGPGLHHLTFKVTDVAATAARAEQLGYRVVGLDTSRRYWKEAFLSPRSAHGVLIQLAEFEDRPVPPDVTLDSVLAEIPGPRH